jgi:hypothetical protein
LYDAGLATLADGTPIYKYQTNTMFRFFDEEWPKKEVSCLLGVGDTDDESSTDDQSEEQDDFDEEPMDLDYLM